MSSGKRMLVALCTVAVIFTPGLTARAQAQEPRERQQLEWRSELDRRRQFSHRAAAWRFEPARGWRFERQGAWSPLYVWWWVDGRTMMLEAPTVAVMQHPDGRYELRGDGLAAAYHWVWLPSSVDVAAPLPPAIPPAAVRFSFPGGLTAPPPPVI